MKKLHLFLGLLLLVAVGGFWFARSAMPLPDGPKVAMKQSHKRAGNSNFETKVTALAKVPQTASGPSTTNHPSAAHMRRPHDASRIFADFTPEERVKFARRGHGPGG